MSPHKLLLSLAQLSPSYFLALLMNICILGDMIHVTFDNNNNNNNNNEYLYFRWYDSRHFWWLEGSFWLLVQVRQVLPDFAGNCFFCFHVEKLCVQKSNWYGYWIPISLFLWMCFNIHAFMFVCIFTSIHVCIHMFACVLVHVSVQVTCMTWVCSCMCMHVCIYVWLDLFVCLFVCICTHIVNACAAYVYASGIYTSVFVCMSF